MGLSRGKPPSFNGSEPLGQIYIYLFVCLFVFPPSEWGCVDLPVYLVHHKGCVLQFSGFLFFTVFLIRSDKSLPMAPNNLPNEMQTRWEGFGLSKAHPSDGNPLAAAFSFLPPLFLARIKWFASFFPLFQPTNMFVSP